ncbi:unnamed protein product, partial [Owenia fusiformis]
AECRVWGAAHYITFDGHTYDVQTGCWQTLALLYDGIDGHDHPIFRVNVHLLTGDHEVDSEHEHGGGDPEWPGDVSYINTVEIELGQHMYSINIQMTLESISLPYYEETEFVPVDGPWTIFIDEYDETVYITVWPVGFELSFNGRGTGRVHFKIPQSYKGKEISGMCGNFNGDPDDDFPEFIRNYVNPGRVFGMIHGSLCDIEGGLSEELWFDNCGCPGTDNWDIPWNNPNQEFDAGAFMTARMACNLNDVCFGKRIEHKPFKTRSCVMDIYSAPTLDTKCEARADVAKACGKIMKHCHIDGSCIGSICYNGGWHKRYYNGKKTVCGCICAPGYTGNDCSMKKGDDEDMVMCRGWGDVHYITFDKKNYDMQGDCKYYLVKPTTKMLKSELKFSIQAKNKKSHKGATVSTTDYVELHLTKDVFRISQGKIVS